MLVTQLLPLLIPFHWIFSLLQSDSKPPDISSSVKGVSQPLAAVHHQPASLSPSLNGSVHITPPHPSGAISDTSSITSTSTTAAISPQPPKQAPPPLPIEFNSADVRNSLERKTNLFREARNLSNESLLEAYNLRCNGSEVYKNGPPISSNGALVPPPYRDPPPPRTSPLHQRSDSASKNFKVIVAFFSCI